MFERNVPDRVKTHILFKNSPLPPVPENRAGYEMMWKSMVQPDRPQMTKRPPCLLHAGHTLRICNSFSTSIVVTCTRLGVNVLMHYLSC